MKERPFVWDRLKCRERERETARERARACTNQQIKDMDKRGWCKKSFRTDKFWTPYKASRGCQANGAATLGWVSGKFGTSMNLSCNVMKFSMRKGVFRALQSLERRTGKIMQSMEELDRFFPPPQHAAITFECGITPWNFLRVDV